MKQTKLELIKIPWSKMLKLELPEFADRLIELVERYNPEALKIKEMYDLLKLEQSNVNKLVVVDGPHPLTGELLDFRGIRSLYINKIELHLKLVIKKDTSNTSKAVKLVKIEVNRFLGDLRSCKNYQTVSRMITQFIAEVNTNGALQTALESLQFMEHIDNLSSAHNSIQELIVERSRSKSERPIEKTSELVDSVLTATKDFIKQIEIAPKKNPLLDYAPLYNELNVLFIEFRDIINKRVLNNKKKADKNKNETTEMTTTTQQNESVGRMINLNEEEVNLNVIGTLSEEKEEAAAMRSKSMQLPLVNDDEEA